MATKINTKEWMDKIERARQLAFFEQLQLTFVTCCVCKKVWAVMHHKITEPDYQLRLHGWRWHLLEPYCPDCGWKG